MPLCPKCGRSIDYLIAVYSTCGFRYRRAFYRPTLKKGFEVGDIEHEETEEHFEYFQCPECGRIVADLWIEAVRLFRDSQDFERWSEEEW